MSSFETQATASTRYYMNKTKDAIVACIHDMRNQIIRFDISEYPDEADWSRCALMAEEKYWLSRLAMKMHDCFPKDT